MFLVQAVSGLPLVASILMVRLPDSVYQEALSDNYPALENYLSTHSCALIGPRLSSSPVIVYLSTALLEVGILLCIVVAIIVATRESLARAKREVRMSSATYAAQRTLSHSLLIQFAVPMVSIVCSFAVALLVAVAIRDEVINRMVIFASVLLISSHTTLNGLMMLVTIAPYRRVVVMSVLDFLYTTLRVLEVEKSGGVVDVRYVSGANFRA
jgi:hypothetical protein